MVIYSDMNSFPELGFPVLSDVSDRIVLNTLYINPLKSAGFCIDVIGANRLLGALTISGALTGVTSITMTGALATVTDLTMSGALILTLGDIGSLSSRVKKGWFKNLDIANAPTVLGNPIPLMEDLARMVPYIGANTAVNLGAQNFITTGTLGAGATTVTSLLANGTGGIRLGTAAGNAPYIFPFSGSSYTSPVAAGTNTTFYSYSIAGNNYGIVFAGETVTATSNVYYNFVSPRLFQPASGDAMFATFGILGGVNQSAVGAPTGITRGIWVNQTLTSPYDYRAIEWSNSLGHGLYGTGTAPNYLGGYLGIGIITPLAVLHLKAGTATAGTSALRFTPATSVLLTSPEIGAFEPVTDDISYTISTGTARKQLVMTDGTLLTSGRVPYASTNGRLIDSGNFNYTGTTLEVNGITLGASILYLGSEGSYIYSSTGDIDLVAGAGKIIHAYNDLQAIGDLKAATFHVGADAGIDATVTYVDTLLGAKTLTFKKGILTAQA